MSSHFHTPSFGDEEFAIDSTLDINPANHQPWQTSTSTTDSNYMSTDVDMVSADETDERYNINQISTKQKPKNKDPNEPSKPVSAYAAFFRDTQIAIKGQNPNAEFSEVSKIVSSMWDALDPEHKNVYKKNAEIAKREYIKNLTEYRANIATIMSSPTQNNIQQSQSPTSQQQIIINSAMKQIPIASKPAVFTISRVVHPQDQTGNISTQSNSNLIATNTVGQKSNNPIMSPTQNLITNNNISREEQQPIDQPNANITLDSGTRQKCIRDGCQNRSILNLDWEDEYCSNECVIKHCQDVFTKWVQSNSTQQSGEVITT